MNALPGAKGLLSGAGVSTGGGGLLGGLGGAAATLGIGEGTASSLAALVSQGLPSDKMISLASLFLNFLKSNAGEGLVSKILAQVPALRNVQG